MKKPRAAPTPCDHAGARWKPVGALHRLSCTICHGTIEERFGGEPLPSTETLFKAPDGTYAPYDPKGWL